MATKAKAALVTKSSEETVPRTQAAEPTYGPYFDSGGFKGEPPVEEIRQRAYELFVFRGDQPGDALDDWLEAERELRAKYLCLSIQK